MQLPGDRRSRLEAPDRQVRLRCQRLNATKQIRHVLLLRQHRLETLEPCFELGDLLSELVQLIRGGRAFRDGDAQRRELFLAGDHFYARRHGVKPVEAADEGETQHDERGHLAVPRQPVEIQVHHAAAFARCRARTENRINSGVEVVAASTRLSIISTGTLEQLRRLERADEIRQRIQRGAAPLERDVIRGLTKVRQPHRLGQRLADLIEQVDRTGLPFPKLFDQRDALLELRAATLELRHLLNHTLQPLCLALRRPRSAARGRPTRAAATRTTSPRQALPRRERGCSRQ